MYEIFLRIFLEMQESADDVYPFRTLGGADAAVREKDKENVHFISLQFLKGARHEISGLKIEK